MQQLEAAFRKLRVFVCRLSPSRYHSFGRVPVEAAKRKPEQKVGFKSTRLLNGTFRNQQSKPVIACSNAVVVRPLLHVLEHPSK